VLLVDFEARVDAELTEAVLLRSKCSSNFDRDFTLAPRFTFSIDFLHHPRSSGRGKYAWTAGR